MMIRNIEAKLAGWGKKIQSNRKFPKKTVILLTNPRSGSTWLLDVLRCHPAIYMHPNALIFERLGLSGCRYPLDLSGGVQATLKVEVHPDQWEHIPDFKIDKGQKFVSPQIIKNPYAIEKCHPNFFNHDVGNFLVRLNEIEKKKRVKLIYQVRDPKATLVSFLQYQQRNPSWYAHIDQDQVPQYIRHIYNSILAVALRHPGFIIDYRDLVNNFQTVVGKLLDYLWSNEIRQSNELRTKLIKLMAAMTDREKRKSESTAFLGEKSGPTSDSIGELGSYFLCHDKEIDYCYQAYNSLLKLGNRNLSQVKGIGLS